VIAAENAYETAKAMLNQAMGAVAADTAYDVTSEPAMPVEGEDAPTARLAPAALAERPDLAALKLQREAGESTVRSFKGAYGPTVAAQASATENGSALDGLVPNVAVGLTVTWPLFQGGTTKGQIHEAEAAIARVDAQVEIAQLQVRAELEQARLGVRSGKAAIVAAEEARTAARERLRLAEGRYAQGIGSVIELGDAQVALTAAGAQIISAELNLATARATLLRVLGRP
jgi:outer membrane protein